MDNNKYITLLVEQYSPLADDTQKTWWENHVKHDAVFRGIKMGDIRITAHNWYRHNLPVDDLERLTDISIELLKRYYAEEKLAGIILLNEILLERLTDETILQSIANIFRKGYIYDCNITDWLCVRFLNSMIMQNGKSSSQVISSWVDEDYLWLARCSIVPFIYIKGNKHDALLRRNCIKMIKRKERFAKTAVGWALMEKSKTNPDFTISFVKKQEKYFNQESLKRALKYINSGLT